RERVLLANELLLYPVEQSAQLARALPLSPFREPGAQVQHEHPRQRIRKDNFEERVPRSWRMTPRMAHHWQPAYESGGVRDSRSAEFHAGQSSDARDHRWIAGLLQRHEVRICRSD